MYISDGKLRLNILNAVRNYCVFFLPRSGDGLHVIEKSRLEVAQRAPSKDGNAVSCASRMAMLLVQGWQCCWLCVSNDERCANRA